MRRRAHPRRVRAGFSATTSGRAEIHPEETRGRALAGAFSFALAPFLFALTIAARSGAPHTGVRVR